MAGLTVKVPIRLSDKAQKDLYETCMAYKELAEMRGAENAKLRELVRDMYKFMSIAEKLNAHIKLAPSETRSFANRMRELGIEDE